MKTPTRILREKADELPGFLPFFSPRQLQEKARILAGGIALMAACGRQSFTFTAFALAIRLSRAAIRHHFVDLDDLLANILRSHLLDVSRAISNVPQNAPDRQAALRDAYLAATRTPLGYLTPPHLLLVRDRHLLPSDLLDSIEATRISIGERIGGYHAYAALALLDRIELSNPQIEHAIVTIVAGDAVQPEAGRAVEPQARPEALAEAAAPAADPAPLQQPRTASRPSSRPVRPRPHPAHAAAAHTISARIVPANRNPVHQRAAHMPNPAARAGP